MSEERIVIVGYKPLPGCAEQLEALMKSHTDILRKEGLLSPRESVTMRAVDGTIVEVFGWKSSGAIEQAHSNPVVQKMWAEYSTVCTYIPIGEVPEASHLFSDFAPIN